MKPIKLTISGFITYRDTQTIDFTKFDQGSLFIISGPTGSGKTTIFDAICFALYGKISSQNRGEGEELRSQYLSPEDEKTFVEFEFEENGKTIWIRREPRQVMKRPRGKVDIVSEEVELHIDNEVMTSKREVDEKIVELTGLTWDQFTKIVMLPQGEFRKFLSAASKEKEEILRKIFDTVPYQRFFEQVKQKYSVIQKKFEKMEDEVNALVSILDTEESACIQEFLKDNKLEMSFYSKTVEKIVETQEENKKAKKDIDDNLAKKEQQYQFCKNQILIANRHNMQLTEFQKKYEELQQLIPQEEHMKKRKTACIQAEKVLSFYKEEIRLQSALDRIQKKGEELKRLMEEEEQWKEKYLFAEKEAEKIPNLTQEEEKRIRQLEELKQKEEWYHKLQEVSHQETELERNKIQLEQEKSKVQLSLKECETGLLSLGKNSEELQKNQEELLQIEKELGKAEFDLEKYRSIYRELKKIENAQQELLVLQKEFGCNHHNNVLLEQELQQSKKALEQSLLAEYGKELQEGKACPLCGSIHHPNPLSEVSTFTKEDVISLEKQLQESQANEIKQKIEKRHLEDMIVSSREQISQLQTSFQGKEFQSILEELSFYADCGKSCAEKKKTLEQSKVKLQMQGEEYKNNIELEKKKREQFEHWQEKMQMTLIQEEKLSVALEHCLQLKKEAEQKLKGVNEKYLQAEKQSLLNEKQQIHETIEQLRTEAKRSVDAYSKISTKASEWKQYQTEETMRYHAEKQEWDTKMKQEFCDMQTYRQNYMEEAVLEQEKIQLDKFFEEYRTLCVEVNTLEKTLESKTAIDINPLEEEIQHIEAERKELQENKEKLQQQYKSIHTLEHKIREVISEEGAYAQKRMHLARLYQLCSGENPMKSTLETYVLMYFFEEVLLYANQRLYKMTDGQYTLYRKEDNFKGGGKNRGLELEILDTNVGKKRSTSMLSGGESFLASLALALGLSDAIMNTAGQIEIDTLFIDEGFGTLDQDRLQNAVDCLLELTGRNRMIGIISHVEELKSTIPNKIIVSYEKEKGSTLSLIH